MKIAACIINIGQLPYIELARMAIRKYYDHFGIECREINHIPAVWSGIKAKWAICLALDNLMFGDLDFAIVQDADLLPCNLKYNILDFILFDQINMAKSYTRIGKKLSESPFPFFQWNAGLIAYGRRHRDDFRRIFEWGKDNPCKYEGTDQYYINHYIGKNELYVNEIPIIFNTFYHDGMEYNQTAFCHYTNSLPNEMKLEYIKKYHPETMLI
jgi:hypothetical protein